MEKKKFFDSIKTKLILLMVLIVAIPIIVITLVSTNSARNSGISQTVAINDAQAHIVEESIAAILDQNMQALRSLAASPATIELLSGQTGKESLDGIKEQLQDIDANFDDGNSTVITGADGKQVVRSTGDLVDIADREYFKKAMEGNIICFGCPGFEIKWKPYRYFCSTGKGSYGQGNWYCTEKL